MTMSATNIYSPLYKVRIPLNILRCMFGFPIQAINETFTRFRFSNLWESIRLVLFLSMFLLEFVIMFGLLLIVDGNLSNVQRIKLDCWNNFSTSKIDHIALFIVIAIGVISSFVYLFVFKHSTPLINELCEEMNDMKLKLSTITNENGLERQSIGSCVANSTKTMVLGQILCLSTSILFGCWAYLILQPIAYEGVFMRYGIYFPLIFPVIYAIETYYRLYGPITCSAELFCDQIINSITDLFDDWIKAFTSRNDGLKHKTNYDLSLKINVENSTMESKDEEK